jgi:hypothetical protein
MLTAKPPEGVTFGLSDFRIDADLLELPDNSLF